MSKALKTFSILLLYILSSACGSKETKTVVPPSLPVASINNISEDRTISGSVFQFTVSLNKTASADANIHYSTAAGTAEENKDFKPVSGNLIIAAGKQSATIDVEVTGDSLRKPNQTFSVQLDNPKNCKISTAKGTGTIINENGLYLPVPNTGYSTPSVYPGYTLAWSDEFNDNNISTGNWSFETGTNNGWGNNELENYTPRTQNAFVSQGNLIIEARQENYSGSQYTSARMITKNKKTFTFGRIDIRAKTPTGKGIWPALWLLGNNIDAVGWPACGEIDLMELLGQEPNKVYGTMHWGLTSAMHQSYGKNYVLATGSFDQEFHVYSMVWKQDSIKMYIDDQEFFSGSKYNVGPDYPFNNNFFFIFNIAVGGIWPGPPDGSTIFPQRMIVDYIRVFQQ